MTKYAMIAGALAVVVVLSGFTGGDEQPKKPAKKPARTAVVSYKKDVMPIFKKYCLPCHTEDNMNPSELYLERYEDLMKGGKHGAPVVAGKPDSSLVVRKISETPPFGDPMPYKFKRAFPADTLAVLRKWIEQGAKEN